MYKNIICHDQIRFIPEMKGCFNTKKLINVVKHIYTTKDKNQMIISINAQDLFDKIPYLFILKTIQ